MIKSAAPNMNRWLSQQLFARAMQTNLFRLERADCTLRRVLARFNTDRHLLTQPR
jgi:hypothetical protein